MPQTSVKCQLCDSWHFWPHFFDIHMQKRHPPMVFVSGPTKTADSDGIAIVESAATDSEIVVCTTQTFRRRKRERGLYSHGPYARR